MAFMLDKQEIKDGLVIFRRSDVKHHNWYCRLKVPDMDRYKTYSLETSDVVRARNMALDHEVELRFKVKHEMPVFDKSFSQVAKEYSDFQKQRADAGEITHKRWKTEESYIRVQFGPYVGTTQITAIGPDKWKGYPLWRRGNGKGRHGDKVSDWTIRAEMATFKSVMMFAAGKKYIPENSRTFSARLKLGKPRGEAFTPKEYRELHTFARKWIKDGRNQMNRWYREVFYNFMLVMTNTGMRPPEAGNFRWRDIGDLRTDRTGRPFLPINVRGKDKFRELVAAASVGTYLERIKKLSKATKPDDFVFTSYDGKPAETLYGSLLEDLLTESGLLLSASGKRRSTYSFRHTYATFRLMEGVDVYYLAKQMGTSVQMIEDYYGHITPVKNAERILQGIPGWEPAAEGSGETASRVKADAAGAKAKPRKKRGA
jgi:integrase